MNDVRTWLQFETIDCALLSSLGLVSDKWNIKNETLFAVFISTERVHYDQILNVFFMKEKLYFYNSLKFRLYSSVGCMMLEFMMFVCASFVSYCMCLSKIIIGCPFLPTFIRAPLP